MRDRCRRLTDVPKLQISFASCPYDRLNPIMSGRVPIEGCDVNFSHCGRKSFFRASIIRRIST